MKILFINGANMNMLGKREPEIYGSLSLDELNAGLEKKAAQLGCSAEFFQSNHEGEIIDKIHSSQNDFDAVIINPGAYSHYSIAIRDAISSVCVPFYEVHLSNIYSREPFRHTDVIAGVCVCQICGAGRIGYELAMRCAIDKHSKENI